MKTFFQEEDYREYINLMSEWCRGYNINILAYCLMPNHIHLIAVPKEETGLARGIGEAHRRYTRYINFRKNWRGFLWQGRFSSCVMDGRHVMMAARYIEMNPVRAGLVRKAEDYEWSSARAHMRGRDDKLVSVKPLLKRVESWRSFLDIALKADEMRELQYHERTGRPMGKEEFVRKIEGNLKRKLALRPPGRPRIQ